MSERDNISNLSKNKIFVNDEALLNTDGPKTLTDMTTIQISKVKILFMLPNEKSGQRFEISRELLEKYIPEKAEEQNSKFMGQHGTIET